MKEIPDTDLATLVESAALNALAERRLEVGSVVRLILRRQEIIAEEIVRDEKTIATKREKLAQLSGRIQKLKSGDWSVLAELEKSVKQQTEQSEQKPQKDTFAS